MARKRIAPVGAEKIGGASVQLAGFKELNDIVLFDVIDDIPQGKALDIAAAVTVEDFQARLTVSRSSIC